MRYLAIVIVALPLVACGDNDEATGPTNREIQTACKAITNADQCQAGEVLGLSGACWWSEEHQLCVRNDPTEAE